MKLTKKEYTSREEKKKDFFIGVGVFIGLNVLLSVLQVLVMMALTYLPLPSGDEQAISLGFSCLAYPLQILANIGVIIYFAFTRNWIALGMLGTFAFLILLALVAGVILSVICFASLGNGI
jgi:hypothetical protein